jgi:hypothetical protein
MRHEDRGTGPLVLVGEREDDRLWARGRPLIIPSLHGSGFDPDCLPSAMLRIALAVPLARRMSRRSLVILAIACLGLAYAEPISDVGWNQGAHYSLVRAIWRGRPTVDRDRWLTQDVAYVAGHYYSAKAPGLALASLPTYAAMRMSGLSEAIDRRSSSRRRSASLTIWVLGLSTVVLSATILLLLVAAAGDRVEPGFGLASAVTLGVGTIVLPFATLYFAHLLSAFLAFAAFLLLWRERDGPDRPRWTIGAAGLLLGFGVTTEYTLGLIGVVLFVYVLIRPDHRLQRTAAFVFGALVGVAPLLVFNRWAYGSVLHLSYADAVSVPGSSGHDVLGANSTGFFGVGLPSPRVAVELLFASRGLLTLSPVLAMSAVGVVLMFLRGRRAESLVVAAVALSFLLFNAGYSLPFGGATPGPRFLIPVLPFLAFPIAVSYRAFPVTTLALGIASTVIFVVATSTRPLLPTADISLWAQLVHSGQLRRTFPAFVFSSSRRVMILAFLVPILAATSLAIRVTPRVRMRLSDVLLAFGCLTVWVFAASLIPRIGAVPGAGATVLVVSAAAVAAAVVLVVSLPNLSTGHFHGTPRPDRASR